MDTPTGPAPVLELRTTEHRGLWLTTPTPTAPGEPDRVWIPEEILTNLDTARTDDGWAQTDTLTQEDALIAAGLAERDGNTAFVRGTHQLAALLHPTLDERGAPLYDPAAHGPFHHGDPGTETMDAEAEQAGFLRCFGCGTLPVTHTRLRYHDNELSTAYDNALLITLHGGYSMFFDGPSQELVACHDCSHQLCDQFPALAATLTPNASHAHTARYKNQHPDHVGWDTSPAGINDTDHIDAILASYPDPDPRIARPTDQAGDRLRGRRIRRSRPPRD